MSQKPINVIIICGGDSNERDISFLCAGGIGDAIKKQADDIQIHYVEVCTDGVWRYKDGKNATFGNNDGSQCEFRLNGELAWDDQCIRMDYAIPYIPGYLGETGHLASLMEMIKLPYFGCTAEVHQAAFNKITQKLWCEMLDIPQVDYVHVNDMGEESMQKLRDFLNKHGDIVVKPARSGSSLGVSQVKTETELEGAVELAAETDNTIIAEKTVPDFMEYMLSCVEIDGEVRILEPMSVYSADGGVLTYHKKYIAKEGVFKNLECSLEPKTVEALKDYTRRIFHGMNLRNVSRIDYFVSENGDIFLMEINTLPGIIPGHSFLCLAMEKAGFTLGDMFIPLIRSHLSR